MLLMMKVEGPATKYLKVEWPATHVEDRRTCFPCLKVEGPASYVEGRRTFNSCLKVEEPATHVEGKRTCYPCLMSWEGIALQSTSFFVLLVKWPEYIPLSVYFEEAREREKQAIRFSIEDSFDSWISFKNQFWDINRKKTTSQIKKSGHSWRHS